MHIAKGSRIAFAHERVILRNDEMHLSARRPIPVNGMEAGRFGDWENLSSNVEGASVSGGGQQNIARPEKIVPVSYQALVLLPLQPFMCLIILVHVLLHIPTSFSVPLFHHCTVHDP